MRLCTPLPVANLQDAARREADAAGLAPVTKCTAEQSDVCRQGTPCDLWKGSVDVLFDVKRHLFREVRLTLHGTTRCRAAVQIGFVLVLAHLYTSELGHSTDGALHLRKHGWI